MPLPEEESQELSGLDQVLDADIEERKKELAADFDEESAIKNLPAASETETGKKAEETPPLKTESSQTTTTTTDEKLPDGKTDEKYLGLQKVISKKDQEILELKTKLETKEQGEQRKAKFQETEAAYHTMLTKRTLQTMKEIAAVAEDDEKYDEKVSLIRARELADIRRWEREHPELSGTFVERTPATVEKPAGKVEVQPEKTTQPSEEVNDEEKTELIGFCESTLKTAGLDPDDPVFGYYAGRAPVKDEKSGSDLSFEEQVEWALGKTKAHYASVRQKFSVEAGVRRQTEHLPLGKGTITGGASRRTDEVQPVSIDDALQEVRRERTL